MGRATIHQVAHWERARMYDGLLLQADGSQSTPSAKCPPICGSCLGTSELDCISCAQLVQGTTDAPGFVSARRWTASFRVTALSTRSQACHRWYRADSAFYALAMESVNLNSMRERRAARVCRSVQISAWISSATRSRGSLNMVSTRSSRTST